MRTARRGQLQIAETMIAISLLLVLSVLIILIANQSIRTVPSSSSLGDLGSNILSSADEAGILRPTVYLSQNSQYLNEYNTYQGELDSYVKSFLPSSTGYLLIAYTVVNETLSDNFIVILGSSGDFAALQNSDSGAVVSTYFLGSFPSAEYDLTITQAQYLVKLFLWEKL